MNVLRTKRLRIISGTRRALQICPTAYSFEATAVQRGLIFFRPVLIICRKVHCARYESFNRRFMLETDISDISSTCERNSELLYGKWYKQRLATVLLPELLLAAAAASAALFSAAFFSSFLCCRADLR